MMVVGVQLRGKDLGDKLAVYPLHGLDLWAHLRS